MIEILISNKTADLILKGFPWVHKNEIVNFSSQLKLAEPGDLVKILSEKGKYIASGYFNPNTNISCRILSFDKNQKFNEKYFSEKFKKALERRFKFFDEGYFRLVYGESDGLPGLIVDLFGEYAVVQINSAGMDKLKDFWLPALVDLLKLKGVFMDGSNKHRVHEGLDILTEVIYGKVPDVIKIRENGLLYFADLFQGQKTGWFYDQRENRRFLANLSKTRSVLDLYTHSGGFGLLCSANKAAYVEMVDRSELALSLADKAVAENGLVNCTLVKGEVFNLLDNYTGNKFDIVNADPPAFIKSKKDIEAGIKGYDKLVKKCLPLINKGGVFSISSCSYFVRPAQFQKVVENALTKSGVKFELLRKAGADKDHPIHPLLSETSYLKFLAYRLD